MRESISIRQERDRVLIIKDGRLILDLPYQAGLDLSRAIYAKSKAAEEFANAESLAFDQAILIRAGAPFGLTRSSLILREATKEANSNRSLRRYMPCGVRSQEIIGSPKIIMHAIGERNEQD